MDTNKAFKLFKKILLVEEEFRNDIKPILEDFNNTHKDSPKDPQYTWDISKDSNTHK